MREVEQKYVTEVQGENSRKLNYYTECVSDKNIRIENKKTKRFVARSSRAPPFTVQIYIAGHPTSNYIFENGKNWRPTFNCV